LPDTRTHRGPHSEDAQLFAAEAWPTLQQATADLSWLLTRGYAAPSSLQLVGNRHQLAERQRTAVERCACADTARTRREASRIKVEHPPAGALWIDGYNVLTTIEVALGGGVILAARDGTYRDMASMHGTYRKVAETLPALELLGRMTADGGPAQWIWFLDRPVSNSGRLKRIMQELAAGRGWPWQIELVPDPDIVLSASAEIIATADSVVLDRCQRWFNLARTVVSEHIPQARVVPLNI